MTLFVIVELILRLIERIPDKPREKAQQQSSRADVLDKSSEAVVRYLDRVQEQEQEIAELRAALAAARARLARCTCGAGED